MESIGKYKIIKELGAGGFGAVYLAEDPRLGVQVAIKVFRVKDANLAGQITSASQDAGGILRERFMAEARTLHNLSHNPFIVNIKEYDELDDGTPYYVMPYLPKSLESEIGKDAFSRGRLEEIPASQHPRKLPAHRALTILEQLLKAMAQVHEAGLIHRDLKPANILFDEQGNVQVCDFGIAKLPDAEYSQSGVGMGSRNYMSPEQRESAKYVSPASDVYSLGVIAYRMLTGQLPVGKFEDISHYAPEVGSTLSELIDKAVSQNEKDRPADAGEFLNLYQQAVKDVSEQGASADDATGTWVGGTDDIKPELKPLEQKIIQLLQSNGEVKNADLPILQALADLGGLSSDDLQTLIEQVKEKQANQSPQQKAFQQWVANINIAIARGDELSPQQINVLVEVGEVSTGKTKAELQSILAAKGISAQQEAVSPHTKDDDVTFVAKPEQSAPGGVGKWVGIAALLIVLAGGGYFGFGYYQQMQEQERQAEIARKNEQGAWNQAEKLNSIDSYDLYLKNWPQGEHAAAAKKGKANLEEAARLAKLSAEEQRAAQIKKAQSYLKQLDYVVAESGKLDARTQKAIEAFEESQNLMVTGAVDTILLTKLEAILEAKREAADIAKVKKQDDEAWNAAKSSNTINAYQQYIASQQQGQYVSQANEAIDNIKLENSKVPLNIITSPADATIQITNIKEKYRDGIKLVPAEYTVKISQKGYETRTDTIRLNSKDDTFRYELERALPEPIIALINSMKPIPAGSFMMGCSTGDSECDDEEKPRHNVNINSFSLMTTEVTRAQFTAFVNATGYRTDAEKNAGGNQGCYA